MSELKTLFYTPFQFHIYSVIILACCYIAVHQKRHHAIASKLDIFLNYIPVLTHEFGHILFNKCAGGRATDFVIVVRPSERRATSQQGYAVTRSRGLLGQIITTLGGYVMPPLMLFIGIMLITTHYPILFIVLYAIIFICFLVITSRKVMPICIIALLAVAMYFNSMQDSALSLNHIVPVIYHFILGVLLGETLQSTWTILQLTFTRHTTSWDGRALADMTRLPTFFYSCFWIVLNVYTLYVFFQHLL